MPPRSKQSQRQHEWSVCERCKCHIFTKDVDVHSDICKEDEPFSYSLRDIDLCCAQNSLQQLRHCFVSNGSAVARLDGMFCEFVPYSLVNFTFHKHVRSFRDGNCYPVELYFTFYSFL